MRATVTVAVLGVVLAGCGGSDDSDPPVPSEVASCAQNQGADASTNPEDLDLVADDAGVGGVEIKWRRNTATVAIERSEGDAENTEQAYKLFAEGFGANADELLRREGTVVVLYEKAPSDEES